ncbi:hypothetical protein [Novipirellula sp.]|uniref:hypothetical protein n=1 Tax=Novipirellula sp. TaxID=2795430 RepID=UPI0035625994
MNDPNPYSSPADDNARSIRSSRPAITLKTVAYALMWMIGSALFALRFSPKLATIRPINFDPLFGGVGACIGWFLFRWQNRRRHRKLENHGIAGQ